MKHRKSRKRHTPNRDRAIALWLAERRRHEQLDAELRSILRDSIEAAPEREAA